MYAELGVHHSTLIRYQQRHASYTKRLDACTQLVDDYRAEHPGGGLVKIYNGLRYVVCAPQVKGISRDRFVAGMRERGRVLKLSPPRPKTTQSGSYRFDNQTRGLLVQQPNQLWVSDTTYFRMSWGEWHYLTFVVDVYTRYIVGFAASDSLAADANVAALQMAIGHRGAALLARSEMKLIFHSDGGKQFTAADFVASLATVNASSSMGFVAQENAFAERVNGIIKGEYLDHWSSARRSISQLIMHSAKAVGHYNHDRLHNSLPGYNSPTTFETQHANGHHMDYEVVVEKWNHDPYNQTDKFTGSKPRPEAEQ